MSDLTHMVVKELKTPKSTMKRNKRHYIKMLNEGRCVSCGKPDDYTRQGRARCKACNAKARPDTKKQMTPEQREQTNADRRKWYHMRKDAHLCVHCGGQDKRTLNGMASCLQCSKYRADLQRKKRDPQHEKELRDARRQRFREAGLCVECGREKEDPEMSLCATCRVKFKLRVAKLKIKKGKLPRGANGICFQCNREKAMEGKKLCPECYEKKCKMLKKNAENRWKKGKNNGEAQSE